MSLMNEDLVRAQMTMRLAEAQQRAVQAGRGRRVSRKAELAARRARLALARAL